MMDELVAKPQGEQRHPYLLALAVIIFLESALGFAALAYLIIGLGTTAPQSYPSAIALVVLAAIAAVWVAIIGIGVLRLQPWTRGATVVWQVLQIAVAIGCFQGVFARPDIGWLLLIPAIVVLFLLFSKPVVKATIRDQHEGR